LAGNAGDGDGVKLHPNHFVDGGGFRGRQHGQTVALIAAQVIKASLTVSSVPLRSTVVLIAALAARASTVALMAALAVSGGGNHYKQK